MNLLLPVRYPAPRVLRLSILCFAALLSVATAPARAGVEHSATEHASNTAPGAIGTARIASITHAPPTAVKVAEIGYSALPGGIRIENSGIYGISTFTISGPAVSLITTDGTMSYRVGTGGVLQKTQAASVYLLGKFAVDAFQPVRAAAQDAASESGMNHIAQSTTAPTGSAEAIATTLTDTRDGSYSDRDGKRLTLRTIGRNALAIASELSGQSTAFTLEFPGDLAYAELIGIDTAGTMFLLTELYVSEIPLRVRREVVTVDGAGNRLSVLEIPDIKYLSTDKDFRIDAAGNLYHLMTTADRMIIFRWPDLTSYHAEPISYPSEYSYSLHYNTYVTTAEAPGDPAPATPMAVASRTLALRIGATYAAHQFTCTAVNLTPIDKTGPDGDVVRTPSWLLAGVNARIPYMWGGFSTLAQYDAGMKSGKYAGDINTAGVSGYSVGVDCSGFVSRCWQMSSHYATSMMPGITTQYASWDDLKPGDAILKNGHVRLFVERTANGGFRVVEASARGWDVSYWTYAVSDLQGVYTPCSYTSMEANFSTLRPMLTSVVPNDGGTARLTWTCDTTGLLGYRIYSSTTGSVWTLIANESAIGRVCSAVVPVTDDALYYRIASVKDDGPRTESDWSNAMGASRMRGTSHYLIVDGYERLNGSWESPANTFAMRYGAALKQAGVTFSTMKNYLAVLDTAALSAYSGVIWFLGDESTATETFSAQEQALLKTYLQGGGKLFVSGSEVGYDLWASGSAADRDFYSNYLKAVYKADNAGSTIVKSEAGGFFTGASFPIGGVYVEDYPDEIDAGAGSSVCMRFANNRAAGVQYAGTFGASALPGKVVYLSFALETAANDTAVNTVIGNAVTYFEGTTTVRTIAGMAPSRFELQQNYPNPFNPTTTIRYTIAHRQLTQLKVYSVIGAEVATLVNAVMEPGTYAVQWNAAAASSGIYYYRLQSGEFQSVMKMIVLK